MYSIQNPFRRIKYKEVLHLKNTEEVAPIKKVDEDEEIKKVAEDEKIKNIIPEIICIGNSHIYIKLGQHVKNLQDPDNERLFINRLNPKIHMVYSGGSTAKGFRPDYISRKGAFDVSFNYIKSFENTTKLFFNFGQVDVEVLYLWKCIDEDRCINFSEFTNDVLSNYIIGLLEIKKYNSKICIIGINPPTSRTVRVILSQCGRCDLFNTYSEIKYNFLIEFRASLHLQFNQKLQTMCSENGFKYIDVWDRIFDNDKSVTNMVRFEYFHPLYDDNHIYIENDKEWDNYFHNKLLSVKFD
jgi:hypothetical protein